MRTPIKKFLAVIFASLLCSCQSYSVFHKEFQKKTGSSAAWTVEILATKDINSSHGGRSQLSYKKLELADPVLLEALDRVSWLPTSYDALALPVIAPRVEIIQKLGADYYLSKFYWEGGVGLLLRHKVLARGNGFISTLSEKQELWQSDPASTSDIDLIAKMIVPELELRKFDVEK